MGVGKMGHSGLGSDAARGVGLAFRAVLVPRRDEVGEFPEVDTLVVVRVDQSDEPVQLRVGHDARQQPLHHRVQVLGRQRAVAVVVVVREQLMQIRAVLRVGRRQQRAPQVFQVLLAEVRVPGLVQRTAAHVVERGGPTTRDGGGGRVGLGDCSERVRVRG